MGFKQGLEKVLEHEGYYSNDSRDNGGETYRGISRRWFPKWGGWSVVDTYEDKSQLQYNEELEKEVENFYYAFFWIKIHAHEIEDDFVAQMVFNFSVNMGKKVIAKKIQRVLQVTPDGIIGPQTLAALNSINRDVFVYHFLLEIVEFYVQLGKDQPHYLRGWLNRAMSTYYDYERLI